MMIDLHTHSILSDGELLPFELIQRAISAGYKAIAITDHVDTSNIDFVVPRLYKSIMKLRGSVPIEVIVGAELTHVPSQMIKELMKEARELGAELIVVHGETIIEPVPSGTNRAAIEACADILAHPGLITTEDILFAKEKRVALEITSRKGHSLSNGYIAKESLKFGVPLVINTDAHSPSDLIGKDTAKRILLSSGIDETRIESVFETSKGLVEKALKRSNA